MKNKRTALSQTMRTAAVLLNCSTELKWALRTDYDQPQLDLEKIPVVFNIYYSK
ncbi:hypothetical protein MKY19_15550 [Paenibacillus sp. FSL R5-0744]|uniref:hypothetical protein n=1 Tax=Paenibacillus sp. FSL R5-0744 TaxID=2921656 RepID=UPI0030DB101C